LDGFQRTEALTDANFLAGAVAACHNFPENENG